MIINLLLRKRLIKTTKRIIILSLFVLINDQRVINKKI
jgi:hypothetical protein